jgi:hypothetical protein
MRMLGEDYKLFVRSSGGVYNPIAGEVGLQKASQTNMRDQSAKGDGRYKVQKPGRADVTISWSGKLQVPDPDGIERIKALELSGTAENYQIRVTPWDSDDVIFEASMYSASFEGPGADDDDNALVSFQLTLAAVPTVDRLTPAA